MSVYSDNRNKIKDGINESYTNAKRDDSRFDLELGDKDFFDLLHIDLAQDLFDIKCASQASEKKIIASIEAHSDFKYVRCAQAFCRPGEVSLRFEKKAT